MNHFLQMPPTDPQWAQIQAAEQSPFTEFLLLDQNVVAGTPPVGYSLVYADPTDRINVASQSSPTQQIAYLSDILPPGVSDSIEAPDGNAQVICGDGGVTVIRNQLSGTPVFSSSVGGQTTVVGCPNGTAYLSCNDNSDLDIKTDYAIKMSGINWSINNVFYPGTDGVAQQVLRTNGAGNVTWQYCPGVYSQTSIIGVTNTAVETSLNDGTGLGNYDISGMVLGEVLQLQSSGTFRNQNAGQSLRFRLYSGATIIWDTGAFSMPTVNSFRPWNLQVSLCLGATLVCNGGVQYRSGTDNISGFDAETSTAYVGGPLQLTVQWGSANALNSLACRRLTLTRTF